MFKILLRGSKFWGKSDQRVKRVVYKYQIEFLHVLLWGILLLPSYVFVGDVNQENYYQLVLSEHLFIITLFYFNYFVLVPALFNKKKILIFLISYFCFSTILFCIMFTYRLYMQDRFELNYSLYVTNFFMNIQSILLYSVVSIFARSYVDWQESVSRELQLKNEKIEAELSYLKTQIDPHFFFNNLNNLYSLTVSKDENAPIMILRLSDMMRSYINNSKLSMITLHEEIEFIRNFIRFQLLKKPKSTDIDLYTVGKLNEYSIAPLLLINYVENAFKHSNIFHDKNASITINCCVDNDNNLEFLVSNTIYSIPNKSVAGIGNKNVKRQLELLYKGRYTLFEENKKTSYKVVLKIFNTKINEKQYLCNN